VIGWEDYTLVISFVSEGFTIQRPSFIIIIINLFAIFSYQIADIYHAMAGYQKNTEFN